VTTLSRFYGGTPWHWLAEAPIGLARRSLEKIGELRAGESILAATRVAVGTGSIKDGGGADIMQQWQSYLPKPGPTREEAAAARAQAVSESGLTVFRSKKANKG